MCVCVCGEDNFQLDLRSVLFDLWPCVRAMMYCNFIVCLCLANVLTRQNLVVYAARAIVSTFGIINIKSTHTLEPNYRVYTL